MCMKKENSTPKLAIIAGWSEQSVGNKRSNNKKINYIGHTTQLRGMVSTLRMRTAISPEQ